MGTGQENENPGRLSWMLRPPAGEFGASLVLLGVLMALAVAALLLDAHWAKALRVGMAAAIYLVMLVVGGGRVRESAPGTSLPAFRVFALAGAAAGLASGALRPAVQVAVVVVQMFAGALLLGGFHWWAVRAWRRVYERVAGQPPGALDARVEKGGKR